MDSGHFSGDMYGQPFVGQFPVQQRPGVDVLFDTTAGEDAVQLGSQSAFAQQREDDRFGDEGFESAFAVCLAVDADEHLARFIGVSLLGFLVHEGVRQGYVVE